MKICKNCGHEIRRQKGVYKHRMVYVTNRTTIASILRIHCANDKKDAPIGTICHCINPEE